MWEFKLKKPLHAFVASNSAEFSGGEIPVFGRLVNGKLIIWHRAFSNFDWVKGNPDLWNYIGDIQIFYAHEHEVDGHPEALVAKGKWEGTYRYVKDQHEPPL